MPELPDLSRVSPPPTRWMWAGRALTRAMVRVRYDGHVYDDELVPRSGPVIFASNHMGYLDGPLLFSVAPRRVHALVKVEMFEGTLGYLIGKVGQLPIDRTGVDMLAVKRCLRILADGGVVAIYPEGKRGLGDVARTRGGAAYLALVSGAPVVPVACLGTRLHGAGTSSMPKWGTRVDMVFGRPMTFERIPWPRTKAQVAAVQDEIQSTLAALVRTACELTGQTLPALPASH